MELSDEQKNKIVETWNNSITKKVDPPSLEELSVLIYGEKVDSRTIKGKAIKEFLATKKLTYREIQKRIIILTEPQKTFIANNVKNMNSFEIAKTLFPDIQNLSPLHAEVQAISNYIKELSPSVVYKNGDENSAEEYTPPKRDVEAIARINKYIKDCIKPEDFSKDPNLKRYIKSFIGFCHSMRFRLLYNGYKSQRDRDLFEDKFIRYVWNKPDLTEEELDLVCNLASLVVRYGQLTEEEQQFKATLNSEANGEEFQKIRMQLVDHLKNIRKDLSDNDGMQQSISKQLQGTRKERLNNKVNENASLINLIALWRNEESRKQVLKLANKMKSETDEECGRLETMDALKFQIHGISKDEILNG